MKSFNFSFSPNVIRMIKSRRMRWAGYIARTGGMWNGYRALVGNTEGKILLGRRSRRWENNIKIDVREVGRDDMDWTHLAQDRDQWRALLNTVMNLRVP
jgi:hypothetical protein